MADKATVSRNLAGESEVVQIVLDGASLITFDDFLRLSSCTKGPQTREFLKELNKAIAYHRERRTRYREYKDKYKVSQEKTTTLQEEVRIH